MNAYYKIHMHTWINQKKLHCYMSMIHLSWNSLNMYTTKYFIKRLKCPSCEKKTTHCKIVNEVKVAYFRVGTNWFLLVIKFNVIHKNRIFDSMLLDIPERPQWTYHFLPKCTNGSYLIFISIHVAGRWKAKQWSSLPFNNSLTLIDIFKSK